MVEPKIIQSDPASGMIDLGLGNPDPGLLPLEAIQRSAERFFSRGDRRSLQYGVEQGDGYFRGELVKLLESNCGAPVDAANIFVTCGASAALDLVCTLYTQPGDTILVEEPTYFLALRIFKDHGLRVKSIPMDADGAQIDTIVDFVGDQPKLFYTVPTFQNPSGRTLSLERRQKLIELAYRHHFLILADEVYHFLSYQGKAPKPFGAFAAEAEPVISVNSFSKILAPGLRLGWIQSHRTVIERLVGSGLLDSGGGLNPFSSGLLRGLLESGGLEENIHKLRVEYAKRMTAMDAALRQHLPAAEYILPSGGFYFWVRFPGINAREFRHKALGFNVDFRPGELFSSRKEMQEYMRLGFCYYDCSLITEGVERLGKCLAGWKSAGTGVFS